MRGKRQVALGIRGETPALRIISRQRDTHTHRERERDTHTHTDTHARANGHPSLPSPNGSLLRYTKSTIIDNFQLDFIVNVRPFAESLFEFGVELGARVERSYRADVRGEHQVRKAVPPKRERENNTHTHTHTLSLSLPLSLSPKD